MSESPQIPSGKPLRVLLVEDSENDAVLILAELQRHGYVPECERVEEATAFRDALNRAHWDCVLSDYALPRFGGLGALQLLQESGLDLPFIIVSGAIVEETAVAAMKAGAHDYVMKHNLARLCPAIEREIREAEVRRERRRAAAALEQDALVAAALSRVGQTLISSVDSPTLIHSMCTVSTEVLGCDSGHTLFWRPEEQVFRSIAAHGYAPEEQEIARVVTLPRRILEDLLAQLAADDVAEVHTSGAGALMPQQRAAHQLCIALRRGSEVIGIQVANRSIDGFEATHHRIGRGIAQLSSLVLEHARVRQELEQSNSLKSDFVATMSHELRTPLAAIMGYTDLLLKEEYGSITSAQFDTFRRIDKSARDLLELINATLDLSRLDKGGAQLDRQWLHLAELVGEIAVEERERRGRAGVLIIQRVPADLPPLYTDHVKLKVVLRNLIGNAFKFTEAGSVAVGATPHREGVEVYVSDTGVGISAEILPIIFEPFRQGEHASTRRFGGVGLGLYIVRRLLDLLGGTVTVDSAVGRGSTFRVWLPQHVEPSVPALPLMAKSNSCSESQVR